ncbi:MAG: 4Fe-4S dicluster domain-containing protein [Oscillospiraceae bacterium]|nr:4Fe-4S dicluster domain-containing protein [Oscillospiraceae bacterium]
MNRTSLLDQIFDAGIVGCGGAGFPTHAKYKGSFDAIVVNGAECEPLLRTDRYLMRHRAEEIITAAGALMKETGAGRCVIGLKRAYAEETAALRAAIQKLSSPVTLHLMDSFYPAGDEQALVYEATGRVVPPAGIPLDVGCVVSNIATLSAVFDAMEGKPFLDKYLTVTGEVAHPVILKVPVGTPIARCLELAGGALCSGEYLVLSGGPMMGAPMKREQALASFVTKTTSGLIVLPEDSYLARHNQISLEHMANRARSSCIQCSYCTQLCPRYLLGHPLEPHRIMRKMAMSTDFASMLADPDIQAAALCCQCGVCELYACPMGLQPRRVNAILKDLLGKAGVRYQKPSEPCHAREGREDRRVPTRRAAARAGVLKYYDYRIDSLLEDAPARVSLALRQHIGAPSEPVVTSGDRVKAGDLIARCPEGKLGANLHASISGTAVVTESAIIIERQEADAK